MKVVASVLIVAAVEEEAVVAVADFTRVELTLGALLLPSRGSERKMAKVMEIPRAVVEAEKLKNKSCLSIKKERWTNPRLGCITCYLERKKKVHQ
jgi:hypothetical protein